MREILLILMGVFITLFIKDIVIFIRGGKYMLKTKETYYVIGNKVINDKDTNMIVVKDVEDDIVQWTCNLSEARRFCDVQRCENFIKHYIPKSKAKILEVKTIHKITNVIGVTDAEE